MCFGINFFLKKGEKREKRNWQARLLSSIIILESKPELAGARFNYCAGIRRLRIYEVRLFHPFRSFRFQQEAEAARSGPTHEWMTNECVSETCFDSGDNKDPLRRHGSAVTATIVSAPASYLPPARANILKIFNGPDTDSGNGSSYEAPIANRTNLFCLTLVFLFLLVPLSFPFFPPQNSSTTIFAQLHNFLNLFYLTKLSKKLLPHPTSTFTSYFFLVLARRRRGINFNRKEFRKVCRISAISSQWDLFPRNSSKRNNKKSNGSCKFGVKFGRWEYGEKISFTNRKRFREKGRKGVKPGIVV